MRLKVTDDKKFLQVISCTSNEIDQINFSFTKKVDNWFIIKRKKPHWDGEIRYIDNYQRVPIGLWKEVENLCKKFHFPLEIEGIEHLYDKTHNDSDFKKWAIEYFKESKINPRDYQLEAASRVLKFKNCTEEISTSGGKTLIAFLIFKYLLDVKKKNKCKWIDKT